MANFIDGGQIGGGGGGQIGSGGGGQIGSGGGGQIGSGGGGQIGSGGGGQIGSGGGGQIGSGGGGQIGSGGGGQIGSGGGGQIGSGGGGQIGSGGGGQIGSGTGVRGYGTDPKPPAIADPGVVAQELISFRLQRQEHSNWCWAAVAVSINKYFDPESDLEQCNVANRVVKVSKELFDDDCRCGGRDGCKCCCHPHVCNLAEELETALKKVHKWRNTVERALQFGEVQREIDGGRPIGVGITWQSEVPPNAPPPKPRGHFVVVKGYRVLSSGARQVYVADPLYGSGLVDFDEFTVAYYGDGKWTETDLVESDWV
jgi:hypothetical protein